jgi:hypothetical protein
MAYGKNYLIFNWLKHIQVDFSTTLSQKRDNKQSRGQEKKTYRGALVLPVKDGTAPSFKYCASS